MSSRISQVFFNFLKNLNFKGSTSYWADRYDRGGNSGPGSYGRFAQFKADTVNRLVVAHGLKSLVELGCGDGYQAALFEIDRYIGLDVAPKAVHLCRDRLSNRTGFECHLYDPETFDPARSGFRCDAALSLDVIYHLVEDSVYFRYLSHLFDLAERYVIIYSSNRRPSVWSSRHVLHRRFTDDIPVVASEWRLIEHVPNPYPPRILDLNGSFADFFVYERSG